MILNSEQFQIQLLEAANEVSSARELLAKAQSKLMSIIGQAHVFGVPKTVIPATDTPVPPAVAPAQPDTAPQKISDLPVSGTTTAVAARAAWTPPSLDFSDEALADVPRSAKSTPAPRTSAPAAQPETAASGPTEEVSETDRIQAFEDQRKSEQLGHFMGIGSLFARYLSPDVISSGKGFLRPGVAGLKQYSEDVNKLSTSKLMAWPTSFYRDQSSKCQQFLVVCDKGALVVPQLPDSNVMPKVSLKQPGGPTALVALSEIPLMDLLMLKESVERVLVELYSKAG